MTVAVSQVEYFLWFVSGSSKSGGITKQLPKFSLNADKMGTKGKGQCSTFGSSARSLSNKG